MIESEYGNDFHSVFPPMYLIPVRICDMICSQRAEFCNTQFFLPYNGGLMQAEDLTILPETEDLPGTLRHVHPRTAVKNGSKARQNLSKALYLCNHAANAKFGD